MPKIRSMSAGRAGAILYNSNVNGNQGGGDKKGGLATTTNKRVQFVMSAIRTRSYSSPDQRKMIFCVNQLGGVGAPSKMFATTADGSCASCSKEAKAHNFVVFAYRQLLGRSVDESGLRKYTKQILNDTRGLAVGMSQVVFDLTNSPEGKKFARKIGSVETQKRIAAANDFITSSTVVPDNFTPIGEEALLTDITGDSFVYDYDSTGIQDDILAMEIPALTDIITQHLTGEEEWTSKTFAEYLQNNWTLSINRDLESGVELADGEWSEFSNIAQHKPDDTAWADDTYWVYLETTPVFTPSSAGSTGYAKIRLVKK